MWSLDIVKALSSDFNLILKYHANFFRNQIDIYERIDALIAELECSETVMPVFDDNIVPYMFSSDLMISDISSVCYEWLHLDKPIVFANPAPGKYQTGKEITDNTYVWQAGAVINETSEILETVKKELESDSKKEIRQELFRYAVHQPDGQASNRQATFIQKLLERQEGKPWRLFYYQNLLQKKLRRFLASVFRYTKGIPR
jgi:CDP-glycerol glycerophosphotransferase (TagB/SpsB family)